MNDTHLHLIITHLPIFGSMLGAIVLVYGFMTGSKLVKNAAYIILIIAAVGGVVAFSTGEAAEELVENIAGVAPDDVEAHEEWGERAIFAIVSLGILSVAGLFSGYFSQPIRKITEVLILVAAVLCFIMTGWTGYLGGKIRHNEIKTEKVAAHVQQKYL